MNRSSVLKSLFLFSLISLTTVIAQEKKRWAFGGAVGTTNDLFLSYDMTPQLQVSVVSGVILFEGKHSWNDRFGISIVYFFDVSDNPLFIGFSPGITYDASQAFIAIVPFGVQQKIKDDVQIRIAAEGIHTSQSSRGDALGVGVSLSASIYF